MTTLYAVVYTRTENAETPYCAPYCVLFTNEAAANSCCTRLFAEFDHMSRAFLYTYKLDHAGRITTTCSREVPRPVLRRYEATVRTSVKVDARDEAEARDKAREVVRAVGPHWT